ncbi:MFS transporter [Paenibacillus assamensis]|uniref:MFS transporter n=1 Tax=Paenibacillus assamensis TaxID=311244 RepID=UPI0004255977|nr:MFS transporter [Paenibacillus assamensis]
MKNFLRRNPKFLRFWLAAWSSEFGDNIRNTALLFVILEQFADKAAAAISINLILEYAPIFLLGPIIGVFADRFDRKTSLSSALLFRAVVMLLFIGAIAVNSVLMIYIGSFLSAISTLVFRASQPAFTMSLVHNDDRLIAASYRQMSISFTNIIGPVVAIMLYGAIGSSFMIVIATVLFIGAATTIIRIPNEQQNNELSASINTKSLTFHSIWSDLKLGFQFALSHKIVKIVTLSNLAFGLVAGVYNVMQMFLITEYLGLPKESLAWFTPIIGVTMLIGSLAIPKIKCKPERLLTISVFLLACGLGGMTIFPSVIWVIAATVLFFSGIVAYNITTASLIQTHVEIDFQGRVSTFIQLAWMGPMLLMSLIVGQLYPAVSISYLFIGTGCIVFLLAITVAYRIAKLQVNPHPLSMEMEQNKLAQSL